METVHAEMVEDVLLVKIGGGPWKRAKKGDVILIATGKIHRVIPSDVPNHISVMTEKLGAGNE